MAAPRGKGIYARAPILYPNRDPAGYAAQMGCQFVAFLQTKTGNDHIRRAQDLGLGTFLWSGPETWLATNWQQAFNAQAERASRLGMQGFIADVECAKAGLSSGCPVGWAGKQRERIELADALAYAARSLPSVGFTSFPSWFVQDIAPIAAPAGVWGSPQLYGIIGPATPAQLKARADRWRALFPAVVPSLAAWRRSPEQQAYYLDHFRDERGGIFWQTNPAPPGSLEFEVLRRWNVNQPAIAPAGGLVATFFRHLTMPFPVIRGRT